MVLLNLTKVLCTIVNKLHTVTITSSVGNVKLIVNKLVIPMFNLVTVNGNDFVRNVRRLAAIRTRGLGSVNNPASPLPVNTTFANLVLIGAFC